MDLGTLVIVNLLGGVALLLWGVRMVRTGVMRAWGDQLKHWLELRLQNRGSAFAAGAFATAILGSGTAMALVVAGFAASGAISTATGLAVLLGADLGSAAVAAVFASGSKMALWASPLLIFVGYVTFSISEEYKTHAFGRMLIGVGLLLLAIGLISSATQPLREASLFHDLLVKVGREAVLAFLIGAVLAWLFHSTLAVILIVASLLANGSLELAGALALILGVNFGGGLPAITGSAAMAPAARRLPVANLMCRGTAAIAALAMLPYIQSLVLLSPLGGVATALLFHMGFNAVTGLLFLPLTGLVSRLAARAVPDDKSAEDSLSQARYIDGHPGATPAVALSSALLETARMSELLDRMFIVALDVLKSGSLETLKTLRSLDDRLNAYQAKLHAYIADIAQSELSPEESRRALEITLYVSNLEHAGDVILLNFADRIKAKAKQGIHFSKPETESLQNLCDLIRNNLKLATAVLGSRDIEGARALIAQKDAFRALENKVIDAHFKGKIKDKQASLRHSALFVDMIRDLHRINSQIVSAGYPIVEAAGLLRDSRIRKTSKVESS